jgi:dTDP-4-dehydrorhamnose 3,5-epimerase
MSAQSKLITCIKGSFLDIAVDLRPKQPTFGKCFIYEINSNTTKSLLIPGEFAHGVYALEDDSILLNMANNDYSPSDESGVNWNSIPELGFIKAPTVSSKDSLLPSLEDILKNCRL